MADEWVTPAAIALLATTSVGMATAWVKTRVDLRKAKLDEERQPVELENVFIGGAEKAVAALQVALDRAETTITRLEQALADRDERLRQALAERDERLGERDRKIDELEQDLTRTLARLGRLQERCEELQARLAEIRTDERHGHHEPGEVGA
ncbi:hypothetical protein [Acrocarpospora sp. B8E8]|uniref:hypothetical protein n=1 Tax=Acrocarpospora sp. B8E8 TaxID=3153572 RepID=UPI00325F5DC2